MSGFLKSLSVAGFTSIRELRDFDLRKLNVLIGANGAGKSNFVEVFRLLRSIADGGLNGYILSRGGADDFCSTVLDGRRRSRPFSVSRKASTASNSSRPPTNAFSLQARR